MCALGLFFNVSASYMTEGDSMKSIVFKTKDMLEIVDGVPTIF